MIKLDYKNIFTLKKVTLLAKVYRLFYDGKPLARTHKPIIAIILNILFKLFKQDSLVNIKIQNSELEFDINLSNTQYHSIYFNKFKKGYEPDVLSLINLLLKDSGVFYDIGSNWGIFSIYALCSNKNNRTVYSFDAQEAVLFDLVKLKEKYFEEFKNLNIFNTALGSMDDEVVEFDLLDSFHSGLFRKTRSKNGTQICSKNLIILI